MKKNLWVLCLLAFLPGCLNQTHYDELMGTFNDVKILKENSKKQDQRIERMEKVLHRLQSGLRPETQTSGVKVKPVRTSRFGGTVPGTVKRGKSIEAVRVTMPDAVLFTSGSTQINRAGRNVLARIAKGLRAAPESQIRIVGYTDTLPVGKTLRGHFMDNWDLSAARAAAVARIFIWGDHINKSRIYVEGRAANNPVANNSTVSGRHQNRRIEVLIVKD